MKIENKTQNDTLLETILTKVSERQKNNNVDALKERAKILGNFIDKRLSELGYSYKYFAHMLDTEQDLVQSILQGYFPVSLIDDSLLLDIEEIIECEPNKLKGILANDTCPQSSHKYKTEENKAPGDFIDWKDNGEKIPWAINR